MARQAMKTGGLAQHRLNPSKGSICQEMDLRRLPADAYAETDAHRWVI